MAQTKKAKTLIDIIPQLEKALAKYNLLLDVIESKSHYSMDYDNFIIITPYFWRTVDGYTHKHHLREVTVFVDKGTVTMDSEISDITFVTREKYYPKNEIFNKTNQVSDMIKLILKYLTHDGRLKINFGDKITTSSNSKTTKIESIEYDGKTYNSHRDVAKSHKVSYSSYLYHLKQNSQSVRTALLLAKKI